MIKATEARERSDLAAAVPFLVQALVEIANREIGAAADAGEYSTVIKIEWGELARAITAAHKEISIGSTIPLQAAWGIFRTKMRENGYRVFANYNDGRFGAAIDWNRIAEEKKQ